jgi:hypothetical protein
MGGANSQDSVGIFKQSMRNWVGIGLSSRPARLHSLKRNWFLGIDDWAPKKFKNSDSGQHLLFMLHVTYRYTRQNGMRQNTTQIIVAIFRRAIHHKYHLSLSHNNDVVITLSSKHNRNCNSFVVKRPRALHFSSITGGGRGGEGR